MSIPALVGDGENLIINFKAVEHRTDVDSGTIMAIMPIILQTLLLPL